LGYYIGAIAILLLANVLMSAVACTDQLKAGVVNHHFLIHLSISYHSLLCDFISVLQCSDAKLFVKDKILCCIAFRVVSD